MSKRCPVCVCLCVLLIYLLALIRYIQKISAFFFGGLNSHKLRSGVFCIVALGVRLPLVYVQGRADFFGVEWRDLQWMIIINFYFLRLL